jgi:hypothetical protein
MPDLPIGSENGLHLSQDLFRVFAFMAHPRSEELRHQFLARMHETVAAEVQPLLEAVFSADFSIRLVGAQLGEWLQPLGGFPTLTASPSRLRKKRARRARS